MRMFNKALAPLLIVLILLCCCAADAAGPVLVGDIPCAFPLVSKPTTMNFWTCRNTDVEFDDVYVWNKYEKMTGIDVVWTMFTKSKRRETVFAALTNKVKMDLIMRCKISAQRLTQYGESGLIIDLARNDLLKTYAPNCWAFLQSHPTTLASVMNPDGSIYALPQVNSGPELRVCRKIFINKKWLDNVGMKLPTTTEEMYQLLKAFKEKDANGNGDPNDEVPLSSIDWMSVWDTFSGAFGLMNRGVHNDVVDCDEATGKVRLIATADGFRDFLEYFNRLYSEGLIDNNIFFITSGEWTSLAESDRLGVFCNTNLASLPADKVDNWVGIEEALEGPNGDKLWSAIRANFHSTGNAVIPATCRDPGLVLRWLDYFWTDEGTLFYHMGVEGETFVARDDGTYDYMPFIYDEIKRNNSTYDNTVAKYSPYPGGGNPTVEIAPYFMGGEMAKVPAATARALFKYGAKEFWPSFTFTAKETETLNTIMTDIDKYCIKMRIEFITGIVPLTRWDSYVEQVGKFKVKDYLDIYQAALDRYRAAVKALN